MLPAAERKREKPPPPTEYPGADGNFRTLFLQQSRGGRRTCSGCGSVHLDGRGASHRPRLQIGSFFLPAVQFGAQFKLSWQRPLIIPELPPPTAAAAPAAAAAQMEKCFFFSLPWEVTCASDQNALSARFTCARSGRRERERKKERTKTREKERNTERKKKERKRRRERKKGIQKERNRKRKQKTCQVRFTIF